MPIEDIAHLVGYANTRMTERVYRKELRPVLTRGAVAMDALFPDDDGPRASVGSIGKQTPGRDKPGSHTRARTSPDQGLLPNSELREIGLSTPDR